MPSEAKREADANVDRAARRVISGRMDNAKEYERLQEKAELLRVSLKRLITEKVVEDEEITPKEWESIYKGLPSELLVFFKIKDYRELKEFVTMSRAAPSVIQNPGNPVKPTKGPSPEVTTLIAPRESRDKDGFTLSKKDFEQFFWGDAFSQQTVGDCYLVAIVNSLTNFWGYEDLIRKSTRKTADGFEFSIPLGSTKEDGKSVRVNKKDLDPQVGTFGSRFNLVKWKDGIKALMIAYGKYVTGKENFDFLILEGGYGNQTLLTLASGFTVFEKEKFILDEKSEELEKEVVQAFYQFDPEKDVMTIGINQGDSYSEVLPVDFKNTTWKPVRNWHMISVIAVDKAKKIVTLSNPHNCKRRYAVSMENLKKYCISYTLGTLDANKKWLGKSIFPIQDNRKSDLGVVENDVKRMKSLLNLPNTMEVLHDDHEYAFRLIMSFLRVGQDKSSQKEKPESINRLIQMTGDTNLKARAFRGEAIVVERDGKYFVESYWKKDTFLSFDPWFHPSITVGDSQLQFDSRTFSKVFQGETNNLFSWYLYPPRLAIFLNKMRHDYIDPSAFKSNQKEPFVLSDNGECLVMEDVELRTGWIGLIKKTTNIFTNPTVVVLKDWSALGINDSDTATKVKIIRFLNGLANQKT